MPASRSRTTRSAGSAGRRSTSTYPWIEGQDYEVILLTETGATTDHTITAATETPDADIGFYGLMALIGLYVGVIPVAIGMLWLPWVRGIDPRWIGFLLAFTIGLLAFLGHRGAARGHRDRRHRRGGVRRRGARVAGRGGGVPRAGGRGRVAARPARRRRTPRTTAAPAVGYRAALLVAIGIGLHNLGEGLAIGSAYAVGSLALGATLVVGFALHNTTEGLAIVAPVARDRGARVQRLALLGLIAGAPAVLGAWIGASAFQPGPGRADVRGRRRRHRPGHRPDRAADTRRAGRLLHPLAVAGLLTGLAVMYVTGLLVSI